MIDNENQPTPSRPSSLELDLPSIVRAVNKREQLPSDDEVPLIVVTGPEGSGTTYVWKSLVTGNPEVKGKWGWSHAMFDGNKALPTKGMHHLSLPARRPCRWLSEISFPPNTKFVASIREKKFAVRSAHRRFSTRRGMRMEEENYERALQEISNLARSFPLLRVRYEDLGNKSTRESIENFIGFRGAWIPFENRNVEAR